MTARLITLCAVLMAWANLSAAQAVKGTLAPDAPPAALTYHGLVPGLDTMENVKAALGEPVYAGKWYNYKMYYPAKDRPGLVDVVHMHGDQPNAGLAEIEAASVPEGFAAESEIRAKLGEPEYELRMATWKMLDYTSRGVRFSLTPNGKTTGVAYLPQRARRVPLGERALVDLSGKRQGPQPAPQRPADLHGLMAGVAEADISPIGENWLDHKYTVVTPLKARVVVFRADGQTLALVGVDTFGMRYVDDLLIIERAAKTGVTRTIIGASHNHASGDTLGVYGFYPADYVRHIIEQTSTAIEQAVASLQPVAELRAASRELPMDGIRVQDLFRNARNPGVLDPAISLLQAIGANGKPIATIVNFACHVESIDKGEREITADFPGYMCDQMKIDGLGQPVFLNGAVGGMVSGDNKARTHESSKDMGLRLAAIVKDLAATAVQPSEFHFAADERALEIPVTTPKYIERYKGGVRPFVRGRIQTSMSYFRIGEAQFISVPGELLPEVSFEVLEKMNGFPRIIVGLGNDQIGYIVPPYDYRDDYYEETASQGPATAYQVRDMALRMIADGEQR